jgi:prepilin-type N-terminal cleavage/methylation domain-containing protein
MRMNKHRQSGFSLIEVMIVTTIFFVVLGAIFQVMSIGLYTYQSGDAMVAIQNQARRIVDKIANEIQAAGLSTISPTPPATGSEGTHTITFQCSTGYSGDSIQWGDVTTIAFGYESGETDNGVDDDGDTLIDEGLITRSVVSGESTVTETLGMWVKENGLSFNLNRSLLIITIEMERKDIRGEILETSLTTSVQIKND